MARNFFLLNPHSSPLVLVLVPGPGADGPSGAWGGAPRCCPFVAEGRRPDGACAGGRGKGGGGPPAGQAPRPPLRGLVLDAQWGEGGRCKPGGVAVWTCAPPLVYGVQGRTPWPRQRRLTQHKLGDGENEVHRSSFNLAFFLGVDFRELAR